MQPAEDLGCPTSSSGGESNEELLRGSKIAKAFSPPAIKQLIAIPAEAR
jgi:hypothetical protein